MLMSVPHRKHTKGNGQNSGGREALKSRDKGTRREALLGGRQDRVVPGVATLDRSPDQSPGVRPISPSRGTEGNQEGWPSWVEYRSGGTGGPHPGVDIFPDLSPRAKHYCGVKCSQGLHFPAPLFIWKPDSSFISQEPNEGMRPIRV